jgi:phage virion morphogenesis protein
MLNSEVKDEGVTALLQRLHGGMHNPTPLMRAIAGIFEAETEANFAAEGRPAWLGLAPATIRQRTRAGTWPGKMLQVSSAGLAASVHTDYGRSFARIGSNKVYAAIQQLGGEVKRAAYSTKVRHRTNARGELLRSEHLKGKGLIFAKDSHKRAKTRWFEVAAHSFKIPARPYLPFDASGNLQPSTQAKVISQTTDYLRSLVSR